MATDEQREQWRKNYKKRRAKKQQSRDRQQRYRDRQATGQFEVRGIVTDCEAKAARIKVAAAEINADSIK